MERMQETVAVELAGGLGKRMKEKGHKPLIDVNGLSLAGYFLETADEMGIPVIVVVNPDFRDKASQILGEERIYIPQPMADGNAGALKVTFDRLKELKPELVLVVQCDDSALYTPNLLNKMLRKHEKEEATITLFTLKGDNVPNYFWQVGLSDQGEVTRVFEGGKGLEKKGEEFEAIAGCYIFDAEWLLNGFDFSGLEPHGSKEELILPDVIKQALGQGRKVIAMHIEYGKDWMGVNTPEELEKLREVLETRNKNS